MDSILNNAFAEFSANDREKRSLRLIFDFANVFPDSLSGKGSKRPNPFTNDGARSICKKFFESRRYINLPPPSTSHDEAVKTVLIAGYNFSENSIDEILKSHQFAMIAENNVGSFLERYVASKIEDYGWAWCSGDLIKATDFILKKPNGWGLLQIKNRNNSENSSSSAIREGTEIIKWYRSNSKSGQTRWNKFPDKVGSGLLSEKEFLEFTANIIKHFKNQT